MEVKEEYRVYQKIEDKKALLLGMIKENPIPVDNKGSNLLYVVKAGSDELNITYHTKEDKSNTITIFYVSSTGVEVIGKNTYNKCTLFCLIELLKALDELIQYLK